MLILTNRASVRAVQDEAVQRFLDKRLAQLAGLIGEPDGSDVGGQFVIVQPGDTAEAIEAGAGVPLLHGLFDDAEFGSDNYAPCFEWVSDHGDLYEILFVLSDGGNFTAIVIPRHAEGIDRQLLALAATYATPEPASP